MEMKVKFSKLYNDKTEEWVKKYKSIKPLLLEERVQKYMEIVVDIVGNWLKTYNGEGASDLEKELDESVGMRLCPVQFSVLL